MAVRVSKVGSKDLLWGLSCSAALLAGAIAASDSTVLAPVLSELADAHELAPLSRLSPGFGKECVVGGFGGKNRDSCWADVCDTGLLIGCDGPIVSMAFVRVDPSIDWSLERVSSCILAGES